MARKLSTRALDSKRYGPKTRILRSSGRGSSAASRFGPCLCTSWCLACGPRLADGPSWRQYSGDVGVLATLVLSICLVHRSDRHTAPGSSTWKTVRHGEIDGITGVHISKDYRCAARHHHDRVAAVEPCDPVSTSPYSRPISSASLSIRANDSGH